jgi:hypothetical protein
VFLTRFLYRDRDRGGASGSGVGRGLFIKVKTALEHFTMPAKGNMYPKQETHSPGEINPIKKHEAKGSARALNRVMFFFGNRLEGKSRHLALPKTIRENFPAQPRIFFLRQWASTKGSASGFFLGWFLRPPPPPPNFLLISGGFQWGRFRSSKYKKTGGHLAKPEKLGLT